MNEHGAARESENDRELVSAFRAAFSKDALNTHGGIC